jgi:hypothetical protein
MAQRRHHYEAAFEAYLRDRRIPYVAVDEARKALLPRAWEPTGSDRRVALKSFDFVLYGDSGNVLAEVKGRRAPPSGRLEHWVTLEDVVSLTEWERLFGPTFEATFVFVYEHAAQPRDALFEELFDHHGLWFALRAVSVREYAAAMRPRSAKWGTVDISHAVFDRINAPFTPKTIGKCGDRPPSMLTFE